MTKIAATPAVGGEPVAYRWKYEDEESWTFTKKPPDYLYYGKDVICEPLYAAQPAAPAVGGDPVAWSITKTAPDGRVSWQELTASHSFAKQRKEAGYIVKPLYAAQPAAPLRGSIELAAEMIYYTDFRFVGGPKPEWVPNGNSHKQDEARKVAEAILRMSSAPPEQPAAAKALCVRLREMPSSLNDACRTMDETAAWIEALPAANSEDVLAKAIHEVERDHPLLKCWHGNNLHDGAGELLEPACGCRANYAAASKETKA
jgi:hypothetical protein